MKYIYTFLFLSCFQQAATAQFSQYCGSGRFDTEVFSNVQVSSDIVYGANTSAGGGNTILKLDVYEPSGDTMAARPLIVFVHGGSFIGGTKTDADMVSLCQHFARRGYVCTSIDYRLGMSVFPPDETAAKQAVFRAVQDMKAAVRFFRKDAATTNTYRIDPSVIFGGGSSAGAFTALHLAYLDDASELPSEIDTTLLGGLEGNSGNPGFSSEINAVINLCGALADKQWMNVGDEPLVSMHGPADQTVPYGTDVIVLLGIVPIMVVDGSHTISAYADSIGLQNEMYTFFGAGHVPYLSSPAYMDTTVRFVSNFLYRYFGCQPSNPDPQANTFTTGIYSLNAEQVKVTPNPVVDEFRIIADPIYDNYVLALFDVFGRKITERNISSATVINRNNLPPGIYFYTIAIKGVTFSGKLIFK